MRLREFLKPSVAKALVYVMLLYASSVVMQVYIRRFKPPGTCGPLIPEDPALYPKYVFIYIFFVLYFVFMYLVSCSLVWFWSKKVKKCR